VVKDSRKKKDNVKYTKTPRMSGLLISGQAAQAVEGRKKKNDKEQSLKLPWPRCNFGKLLLREAFGNR
jgi:hypothetical protein